MGIKLTERTSLKTGDLIIFCIKKPGPFLVGEVVSERRISTPVGLRRLLYLCVGDGVEHFGTRKDFMRHGAMTKITISELVKLTNHLAPLARVEARRQLRDLK